MHQSKYGVEKSKYLAVVGLEGSGKTTVIKTIERFLEQRQLPVCVVREPGGTPLAEIFRSSIKEIFDEQVFPETEVLAMYASRIQLLNNRVIPALAEAKIVVSDRCYVCTNAYQGAGGVDEKLLEVLGQYCLPIKPDVIIFLDVDPSLGLQRARERGALDRIEQNELAYFERARLRYLDQIQNGREFIVDANQSVDDVSEQVVEILTKIFCDIGCDDSLDTQVT